MVVQLYSVCELKEEGTTKYMRREQANRGSRSLDKGTPALVIPIHLCINQTSQQMLSELMYKNEPLCSIDRSLCSHCVVLIGVNLCGLCGPSPYQYNITSTGKFFVKELVHL